MNEIDEIETRLDALTSTILVPMRLTKYVDHQALDALNDLVDELTGVIGDARMIDRPLVGKLWFVFTQMLAEAGHTRSPAEILRRAWDYVEHLEELFGPWV